MKALAISNFPTHFNENKIRPEFAKRGIDDLEFINTSKFLSITTKILEDRDRIFLFCDMLGHSEYYSIKEFVKKSGRKLELLNRKSSSWNILPQEYEMAAPKSVNREDLPALIKDYDFLCRERTPAEVMVKKLSKYWVGRPLTNIAQLVNYVERNRNLVSEYEDLPRDNDHFASAVDNPSPSIESPTPEAQLEDSPVDISAKSNQELIDMIKFLEEYNSECNSKLKKAESDLGQLRSIVDDLKRTNIELNKKAIDSKPPTVDNRSALIDTNSLINAKSAAVAVKTLVDLGVMSPSEGFEKIVKSVLMLEV